MGPGVLTIGLSGGAQGRWRSTWRRREGTTRAWPSSAAPTPRPRSPCLPAYLPTYRMHTCLPTHTPACLPTYLRTYIPAQLPTCLYTSLPTSLPIYACGALLRGSGAQAEVTMPTHLPTACLPAYVPTYLHRYLPSYLAPYLPTSLPPYLPIYACVALLTPNYEVIL